MSQSEPPDDQEILLFATSADGSIDAIVQQDGRTIYFYLNERESETFGTRACWVRNLVTGPIVFSEQDLKDGKPPILPRLNCSHRDGLPAPSPDELEVVWLEEGNGAALMEGDELLVLIPPWSGKDGFHGYARDCTTENTVCWPMPANPALRQRIDQARAFWKECKDDQLFLDLRDEILRAYEKQFGTHEEYFAIDNGCWPPKALVQFRNDKLITMMTVGVSLRPQPNVELQVELPSRYRRIELGIQLSAETPETVIETAARMLSGQAAFPWNRWTWFAQGHTCQADSQTEWCPDKPYAIFCSNNFVQLDLPDKIEGVNFRGDPVNLLWQIPITNEELQQANASAIELLQELKRTGRIPSW